MRRAAPVMTAAPFKAGSVDAAELEQVQAGQDEDENSDDADGEHDAAPVENTIRL
jgi:hypothetical protein